MNEWRRKAAGQPSTTFIIPVRHVGSRCVLKSTTLELCQPNQSQNMKYIWLLTGAVRSFGFASIVIVDKIVVSVPAARPISTINI